VLGAGEIAGLLPVIGVDQPEIIVVGLDGDPPSQLDLGAQASTSVLGAVRASR
jgi:hypothetical protein